MKDLTGQRFGKLVVVEPTDERRNAHIVWKCLCDCGNTTFVSGSSLSSNGTKSCGCLRKKYKDVLGERFGKLLVLKKTDKRENRHVVWKCLCDCGNITYVSSQGLLGGTKSCGCSSTSALDLAGKRFGKLVAIEPTEKRDDAHVVWKCQCDCGNVAYVSSQRLVGGQTKSCGCLYMKDLTGKHFGRLVALEPMDKRSDGGKVVWKCSCSCSTGKICYVVSGNLVSGGTKSCGCLREESMKARKGPLHYRWKPELTNDERQIKRNFHKYKEWRSAVYKKDNHTCQRCGKRGGRLNAHHIEGYADNPELRTESSNGATLCKSCHNEYHAIYGHNHATRKDFEEWISG